MYHGWKFDVGGRCVDMPNEPEESHFKQKVRAVAYPCVERAGLIWAYLGPRETPPPLPDLEPALLADSSVQVYQRECNWMQALEGDIDTCHTVFLHLGGVRADEAPVGHLGSLRARRPSPSLRSERHGLRRHVRRLSTCRGGHELLAHRQLPVPVLRDGTDGRARARDPRAGVGADGRRAHAGHHDLARSAGNPERRPASREPTADAPQYHRLVWTLPLRRQRRQRLPDRSRSPEDDQLHGHRRDLPARPGGHREHGRDLRPHQRAPGQQRCHGHPHPQATDRRGESATRQRQGTAGGRRSERLCA